MLMHQVQSVTPSEPITHNNKSIYTIYTIRDVYNPFDQSCSASTENRCFLINTL